MTSNKRVSDAQIAATLRMEAEQAFIVAEDKTCSGMYAEGMALIGRKMLAGAEAIDRLRAALGHIIHYETHDMDGNTMPESGAAFIAKEALRGADTSTAPLLRCCDNPSVKTLTTDAGCVYGCERCSRYWFRTYDQIKLANSVRRADEPSDD